MQTYTGIENEANGGMTAIARTIRDAWVFGILAESDGFAGRSAGDFQNLVEKVYQAWEPYGHLPSRLPAELAERHGRIYDAAIEAARAKGWNPELGDDD